MPNSFPKITAVDVENAIVREVYFTAADGVLGANMLVTPENKQPINAEHSLLTFCILTLRNGYTVVGESAVVSPENFDYEIGKKYARMKAVDRVWPLLGFALRDRLHRGGE